MAAFYFHIKPLFWSFRTLLFCSFYIFLANAALAVEPVKISEQDIALDLSRAVTIKHSDSDTIQVSTAPSADGIVRRIEVQSKDGQGAKSWAIFSIANPTNEQLDRWLVAPHYRLSGSKIWRPDLGAPRIQYITPSESFALDRVPSSSADIFSITINPGAVITLIAELDSDNLPQLYLWKPEAYKDTFNSYTLYHGIVLGIAGLLALLLSVLFLIRGTILFPATAAFAWAVLAYICVDFHFLDKLFDISAAREPFWRAATEISLAATLSLFLFTFLDLNRWHYKLRYGPFLWVIGIFAVGIFMLSHPVFMAGIARISLGIITILGIILIIFFSFRNYDRAIMLIPSWLLLTFLVIVAFLCAKGQLDNDIVQPAISGLLVLTVLTLAFTVMQYAFSQGSFHQGLFTDAERKALAVLGAQDRVWDWNVVENKLNISPDLSPYLGRFAFHLEGSLDNWMGGIHPNDKEPFHSALQNILHHKSGYLNQNFRLLAEDNNYQWFKLRARPVVSLEQEVTHCIGTLANITEHKTSEERLLNDAIYDNLTRLPNRQLLLDRLDNLLLLAKNYNHIRPSLLVIDFDGFRDINKNYGHSMGDSFLRIMSTRINRLLKPQDTLSRLKSDRFAILLNGTNEAKQLAIFVQQLQKVIAPPAQIGTLAIKSSASIGLVAWTQQQKDANEMLQAAILAMLYAKRNGGNCVTAYRPDFKALGLDQNSLKQDLEQAIHNDELKLHYQAIRDFQNAKIVGFEAIIKWEHPTYGTLSALDLVTSTENQDLALPYSIFLLKHVAKDLSRLQDLYPKKDYFISVNLPSSDSLAQNFLSEVKSILLYYPFKAGRLMIEFSEDILMDNPEQARALLKQIRELGFHVVLDNFGQGLSSLTSLLHYKFDMLKLTPNLVQSQAAYEVKILKAIVHLAHDLGIKVIAEGVETAERARFLQELSCEYVQRLAANTPVPIEKIPQLLEKHS